MVPKEPSVAEIKAMPLSEAPEERIVNPRAWQADCRDLHQVLHTCQAVFLLFEHIYKNEALLRVAVEIVLCARSSKMMWWKDGWWPDQEKRDLFKEIILEKLRICLMQFKFSQDYVDEEKNLKDDLESQLARLTERVKAAELTIDSKDAEIRALTMQNETLEKQLAEARHSKENLNKTVDELRKQVQQLQGALDAKSRPLPVASSNNDEEAERRRQAEQRCSALEAQVKELEKSLKDLMEATVPKEELHKAQQRIADLEKSLEQALNGNKKIDREVTPTPMERKASKEARWKGKFHPQKEDGTVADLQKQLEEARRTAEDFRRRLQLAEEDKRLQEESTKSLRDLYHKVKAQLDQLLQQSKELGEHEKDQKERIHEGELRIQQAEARALKAEAAVIEATEQVREVKSASAQALASMEASRDEARAQVAELQTTIKDLKDRVADLESDLHTARAKMHDEALRAQAAEDAARKAQESQSLRAEEIEAWQQRLDEAESTIANQAQTLEEADAQIEHKANILAETEAMLLEAQEALEAAKKELDAAKREARQAHEKLKAIAGSDAAAAAAAQKHMETLEDGLAAEASKLREALAAKEEFEMKLKNLQEQFDGISKELATKDDKLAAKGKELDEARQTIKDLRSKEASAAPSGGDASNVQRAEIERLKAELEEAQRQVQELTSSWNECRAKIKAQAAELQNRSTELEETQAKLDRALKTIHVVKSQIDKLQTIAKRRGYTREVEDVMGESGMLEYLNNPEWSIFERLYQDARRRHAKQVQLEKVKSGQFGSLGEASAAAALMRARSGTASLPRAISHALTERIGIMPSLHLDSMDDDIDGITKCPRCGFAMLPVMASPHGSVKVRSRHGSCATAVTEEGSESTRTPRNMLQVVGSQTWPDESGNADLDFAQPPDLLSSTASRTSRSLGQVASVDGVPLPKRQLISAATWSMSGGAMVERELSPQRLTGKGLTSTWGPGRLRKLRYENEDVDTSPSAMERDCGPCPALAALTITSCSTGSLQATASPSEVRRLSPSDGRRRSSGFGAGAILHMPPAEESAADVNVRGEGLAAALSAIEKQQQQNRSRPGSSNAGSRPGSSNATSRPGSSAAKRLEALHKRRRQSSSPEHAEAGNIPFGSTPSRPASREKQASTIPESGVAAAPMPIHGQPRSSTPTGNIRWPDKANESMVHSLSLPGLQELAMEKGSSVTWPPPRRGTTPKKKGTGSQSIMPRAGWFGGEPHADSNRAKSRLASKESAKQTALQREHTSNLEQLQTAASEDPALMTFLRELSD